MRTIPRWILIGSLAGCAFVIGGGCIAILGPIFPPIMHDLGWSNAKVATLATGYTIANLASNPVVGAALDRLGARMVLLLGVACMVSGLMCAGGAHSWMALIACFVLIGVGMTGVYLPSAVVIPQSLPARKGLGMGIFMGALSAGAAVFMPVVGAWVDELGWRPTLLRLVFLDAAFLPIIWFCVQTNRGRTGAHVAPDSAADSPKSQVLSGFFSVPFLVAALSSGLFTVGMLGIYYDVVDLLVKAGYSQRTASLSFGATWLVSSAGSLVFGLLADRFGPLRVLAAVVLICACGTLCLLGAPHPQFGIVFLVGFIVLWGSTGNGFTQLLPAVFLERFGPAHLGTLLGAQFAIAGVAGSVAPLLTGMLVDRSGDYRIAVLVSACATLLSAVLISSIGLGKFVPRSPSSARA